MSLLLDALKKAAEKNSAKDASAKDTDKTQVELTQQAGDKTVVVDQAEIAATSTLSSEQESITELELAAIIGAQKKNQIETGDQTVIVQDEALLDVENDLAQTSETPEEPLGIAEDETDIRSHKPSMEELALEPAPALYEEDIDEDPSLKLALSDEEIILTDDDVTEFLGGDELGSHFDQSEISLALEEDTELKLDDNTAVTESVNLADPATDFTVSNDDTTAARLDLTSTTTNAGQTTNLGSLTNDATLSIVDATSTQTFASDNYDRTLVKLDDDVSKVFTGLKSDKSGAAMTPDFAKKVFIQKSTSLRRQNYKIYGAISIVVLIAISVLALFEMQTQIDEIDTSLVRLKQNPVPSALRFKRQEKIAENNAVLQGNVDTEAMKLLKSLDEKNNAKDEVTNTVQNMPEASTDTLASVQIEEDVTNTPESKQDNMEVPPATKEIAVGIPTQETLKSQEVPKTQETSEARERIVADNNTLKKQPKAVAASAKKPIIKKPSKPEINIQTKVLVSQESVWLKEAYAAFERGNLTLAAMNYEKVLEKDPANRDALLGQAAIYSLHNNNMQAIDNYQAILLENPKDILAMTSLITASSMSPIESESRLKILQRESPNATYLHFALGNVVSAQNRWQEAQQYYFKAFQAEPDNPDYAYNLAVSLEQINKPDVAINYYAQALKNAQNMPPTFDLTIIEQRIEVLGQ